MKQHSKRVVTEAGTQVTVDELEEMAFEEHGLIKVDNAARVYHYIDNGGVHYVAPMRYIFVAPPTPGDAIQDDWARGCGQRRPVSQLDCTVHVGDYHVATSTAEVLEVWSR
jgi:hypothetical protein